MMFKMLNYEMMQASPESTVIGRKRRQMFVTQSRVLARRVQEYFTKLLASLKTATLTREELQNVMRQKAADENDELIDEDDEGEEGRSDLPKRFSELEDKHFPLFLTFDEVILLNALSPPFTDPVVCMPFSSTALSRTILAYHSHAERT